jgi:hypothetical protein
MLWSIGEQKLSPVFEEFDRDHGETQQVDRLVDGNYIHSSTLELF